MKKKILIATSTFGVFSKKPINLLKENNYQIVQNNKGRKLTKNELESSLKDCCGVIAGTETYDAFILNKFDKLRVISRLGVGIDNIDTKVCKRKSIKIETTTTNPSLPVAELTIGLILDLLRSITVNSQNIKSKLWIKNYGELFSGKKLGIIGLGNIGKELVRLLKGFNLEILAYDKYPDHKFAKKNKVRISSLDYLLKNSDIITIHLSLNKKTRNLISSVEFRKMKKNPYLVNTSRAEVINEKDLLSVIKKNKLKGFAFDVFHDEPYFGEILKYKNTILTPHIGSYAREIRIKMEDESVKNLIKITND